MARASQQQRRDVPKTDHVARFCNRHQVIRDTKTKKVTGLYLEAFELRSNNNEEYLSTQWMEKLAGDIDAQFQAVLAAFKNKRLPVGAGGAIARLNAGRVVQAGTARNHPIRIRDRSKKDDPGYSGIYGMPLNNSDRDFLAELANGCCVELREVLLR